MTVRPGKGVICMGQTGMTPYEFLYLLAASWLLLWLALSVITLKFRLHQRERKGREQFRYEKLFFSKYMQRGRNHRKKLWRKRSWNGHSRQKGAGGKATDGPSPKINKGCLKALLSGYHGQAADSTESPNIGDFERILDIDTLSYAC